MREFSYKRILYSYISGVLMWVQIIDDGEVNFAATLYSGTGAAQNIETEQNTSAGCLAIGKRRDSTGDWYWQDTVRGAGSVLVSNSTAAQITVAQSITSFNSNGLSLGTDTVLNASSSSNIMFTMPEREGFFDVVSYSGTGTSQALNHTLGEAPGLIIIHRLNNADFWPVYHQNLNGGSSPEQYYLALNTTAVQTTATSIWNNTAPTSTQFTVGTDASINASGGTYIAYLFASSARERIKCGSFTSDAGDDYTDISGIGFKPKTIWIKTTNVTDDWRVYYSNTETSSINSLLYLNQSTAEITGSFGTFTSSGITGLYTPNRGGAHIYMAAG